MPAADWAAAVLAELAGLPNVRLMPRTTVTGAYDDGTYGALERVGLHLRPATRTCRASVSGGSWPRSAVLAAGALERPIAFPNNDRPGIMLAGAVRTYLNRYGVAPGKRVTLFANNDDARAHRARPARRRASSVAAVIDSRARMRPTDEAFPVHAGRRGDRHAGPPRADRDHRPPQRRREIADRDRSASASRAAGTRRCT